MYFKNQGYFFVLLLIPLCTYSSGVDTIPPTSFGNLTSATKKPGVCINYEPIFVIRCCKDFYNDSNVCIECPSGRFGIECNQTCPEGFYGKHCLEKCMCETDEKCDTMRGCVRFSSTFEKCKGGSCGYKGEVEGEGEGDSHIAVVVTSVAIVLLLLVLLGLLIRKNIRSSEKSFIDRLYEVFYRRGTDPDIQNEQQVTENGNGISFVDDGAYVDIRVSQMIRDCEVGCSETVENRKEERRYQDPKFLQPASGKSEDVEYSRCKKVKSSIYNKISLRNRITNDDCEYEQFSRTHKRGTVEKDSSSQAGKHTRSLAVCSEEAEIGTYNFEMSTSDKTDQLNQRGKGEKANRNDELTDNGNKSLVHETAEKQSDRISKSTAKVKSSTLTRMLGRLSQFQLRH